MKQPGRITAQQTRRNLIYKKSQNTQSDSTKKPKYWYAMCYKLYWSTVNMKIQIQAENSYCAVKATKPPVKAFQEIRL